MASEKVAFMILLVILVIAAIYITQKIEQLLLRLPRSMGKRSRKTHSDGLYHLLAPSLICTCICMVCLCGASWAWFSAAYTNPVAGITAAVYDVEVTVTDSTDGEADIPVTPQNLCYQLSLDTEHSYNVGIRATGTASSGYCSVIIDGTTYYTHQISPNSTFTFNVNANQAGSMQVIPQWGTCAVTENNITSGGTIEFGTASSEHPVVGVADLPSDPQPAQPEVQSPADAPPQADAQPQAGAQNQAGTQPAPSDSSSSDSQVGSNNDSSVPPVNDATIPTTSPNAVESTNSSEDIWTAMPYAEPTAQSVA